MAAKKELKKWGNLELTPTMYDVIEGATEVAKSKKAFCADDVVAYLTSQGKTYSKKSVVASLARLNTTCGVLKKNEPIKVTTYEINEED